MIEKIRAQATQISLVFTIFLLFVCNGTGLLEIQFQANSGLSFRSLITSAGANQGIALPAIVYSIEFFVLLAAGLILSLLLPILNPIQASLLTAACAVLPIFPAFISTSATLLPLEFSLLTILILYAVNVLFSYFKETVAKQKIVDVFGQFIPPQVVAEISKNPGQMNLEGESKYLTVFFCDLQNFTGVSEQLNPKQLARLLNEYFNVMTEILYSHGATIDKYIGEAGPVPQWV